MLEHDGLRSTSFQNRRHQGTPSAREQHELQYRVTHLEKRIHCSVLRAINGEGGGARTRTQRIHARIALDVSSLPPSSERRKMKTVEVLLRSVTSADAPLCSGCSPFTVYLILGGPV